MWQHGRTNLTIFCVWDYRSESIFHPQSRHGAEIPSVVASEAAVYKQTNAIHRPSALTRTAPNFLASEPVPRLWTAWRWLAEPYALNLPTLLEFDTSLRRVKSSTRHLQTFFPFHRHAGFVEITVLEPLRPFTNRSFTNSCLAKWIQKHSIGFSHRFLWIERLN